MKRLLMAFLACFVTLCAWAQGAQGEGTVLLDDLDSNSRVVVDAFANASNRIHSLIQEVSPKPNLEGFAKESDLLAFYYPEGGVTSMDQITTNGIEYAVGSDGGAYVVSGNGLSGHVVLPWKVNIEGKEYKVTAIGDDAFSSQFHDNSFIEFTAPITVKTVSSFAFFSCVFLKSVSLPSTISIGRLAFTNCSNLNSVFLPSATSIGDNAFNQCVYLITISLPSATSIGDDAFYSCIALKSIYLPSVVSIGGGAFVSCNALTTVDFGASPKASVPVINGVTFYDVPTSCKFIIPLGMYDEWVSAYWWKDLYAQGYKFDGYASVSQNVGVPNVSATGSVVRIGANATTATTNSVALGHDAKSDGTPTVVSSSELSEYEDPEVEPYADVNVGDYGAVAEGYMAKATGNGATAISPLSEAKGNGAVALGRSSSAKGHRAVALGDRAISKGTDTIQLGHGSNTESGTFKVLGHKMMNADGTIPPERVTGLKGENETRSADSLFRSMDNANVLWSYVHGETVWIAVTNYMRTVAGVSPSFQLWEVRDGKTNCVYWSAEEIDIRVGDKIDVAVSNVAHTIATQKADRAWSKYQSMTGEDNPEPNNLTIVSTPSVMLSGGYEWQRYADTYGEIWVLSCNTPTTLGKPEGANLGKLEGANAYFRITDIEGKTHFSIEKTNASLVDVKPTLLRNTSDSFRIKYQTNIQPRIWVSPELTDFLECTEVPNEHGASLTWEVTQEGNLTYHTAIITVEGGMPSRYFAYAKVLQEGKTVIKNTAPSSFDGGVVIGNTMYSIGTTVINGKTVLTLENGAPINE